MSAEREPEGALPRLVLLPGIDGTGRLFARLEAALDGRLASTVIPYPVDRPLDYPALADLVLATLGPGPVLVLGELFSGPVAIAVARAAPERVVGLVLACTFATPPLPPWLIRLGAVIDATRLPRWLIRATLIGPDKDKALADEIGNLIETLPPAVIAHRMRSIAGVDARASLAAVRCPVLILHGSNDRLVKPSFARQMKSARPDATVQWLPAPHTLLQRCPEQAAGEIVAFAQRCNTG